MTASVDRNQLSLGETLQLEVKWDEQVSIDPDFSSLEHDFEILSRQQQNQFSIINGRSTSFTTWRLELLPKREGKLLIPSFNFKNAVSDAIEITVSQGTPQQLSDSPVYLETSLDKEQLYVQEQLLLTHRIITRVNLQGIANDDLILADATVIKVSENQFQKQINGIPHLVIEIKYALFPQNSGVLEIPSVRFSTIISDRRDPFGGSLFSPSGKRVFLNSDAKTVAVLPRPAAARGSDWLPSNGVSLGERWSRPLNEWRVGEPITRTITLTAQGLTGAQLPPLSLPAMANIKVYPDQPQLDDKLSATGVIGQRIETMALVPAKAGKITLPPVTVRWWDTKNQQLKETTLAGQTIQVLPANDTAAPAETATDTPQSGDTSSPAASPEPAPAPAGSLWLILLALSNLVLLLIIAGLLWQRRRTARQALAAPTLQQESAAKLFSALQQAAQAGDLNGFREATLRWARVCFAKPELSTLQALAEQAQTEALRQQLAQQFGQLDRALFADASGDAIDLRAVLRTLKDLRNQHTAAPTTTQALKPLYEKA